MKTILRVFGMDYGCLLPRQLTCFAGILAFHDMGPNEAPVRFGRSHAYSTLLNELQRHASNVKLSWSQYQSNRIV